MSGAVFPVAVVVLSVIISLVIWAFSRKPKTFMSSIDDFEREMKALGREAGTEGGHHLRGRHRMADPGPSMRHASGRPAPPDRAPRPAPPERPLRPAPPARSASELPAPPMGRSRSDHPEERRP